MSRVFAGLSWLFIVCGVLGLMGNDERIGQPIVPMFLLALGMAGLGLIVATRNRR